MRKNTKTFLLLLPLSVLMINMLLYPAQATAYAGTALVLWFENMIPSLFGFMILTGVITRMDLGKAMSLPFYPVIGGLYKITPSMCTTMVLGFLCGYPLGAKIVSEEYQYQQLSRQQASYLLSFCNNIGPIYMLSFALPLLKLPYSLFILGIHMTIPAVYGILLRRTVYRDMDCTVIPAATQSAALSPKYSSFLEALDDSIYAASQAMLKLGGYMILFMECNLCFWPVLRDNHIQKLISPLLEITSGLKIAEQCPPYVLCSFLCFGGLSCLAQTYTCIKDTDLSFTAYVCHKILQSLLALLIYSVFFYLF